MRRISQRSPLPEHAWSHTQPSLAPRRQQTMEVIIDISTNLLFAEDGKTTLLFSEEGLY